jgi:hydrogenase maturation protease
VELSSQRRIVVLGLGNPVLRDDAAGLRVAEAVERLLAAEPLAGVVVEQSTRAGFELIDLLQGCEHAIIIDALDDPAGQPGALRELALDQISGSARLINAHGLSLAGAFQLAQRLGVPMPASVAILGVVAGDSHTLAEGLTPAVEQAIAPAAALICGRLKAIAERTLGRAGPAPQKRSFYDPSAE